MKICFCNILYSKINERGGLGSHIHDLSTELAARGHEVVVLTSGDRKEYTEDGVRVIQLGRVSRFSNRWQILNPFYLFQRLFYMCKLAISIRRMRFDLVEAAEGGAEHLFLLFARSCPIITKLHGNFRYIYGNRFLLPIVETMERMVVAGSDGAYASSSAYAQRISIDYRIPLDAIKIIPYGIKIEPIAAQFPKQNSFRSEYGIPEDQKLVFLSAGASPVRKGAPLFLDVAKRLSGKSITFVLACSDMNFSNRADIPENVVVIPHLGRQGFHSLLKQVDLVVFPSQFESFCIAAYEAMLLGKTLIVSKNLPLEGTVRQYSQCVVLENLDIDSLAGAILNIVEGKNELSPVQFNLLSRMRQEYDIGTVAELTEAYYREICGLHSESTGRVAKQARA